MSFKLELVQFQNTLIDILNNIDYVRLYNSIGKILLGGIADQIRWSGGYFDEGESWWQPLAPSTIKQRERLGYKPIRMLRRRSGDAGLFGSFNYSATQEGIEIGTNVYYAKFLHEGTKFMPARPLLPQKLLPIEMLEDMAEIFEKHIKRVAMAQS
jgi:hypothetical protein